MLPRKKKSSNIKNKADGKNISIRLIRFFNINISSKKTYFKINIPFCKKIVKEILNSKSFKKVPKNIDQVSITFTDDKEIRRLNRIYRGKDKSTDVLSFSQLEGKFRNLSKSLGDLVISVPTAKKQHNEYGCTFPEEILRLLIHGLLHLAGYDHENVSDYKRLKMQREENKLFKTFYKKSSYLISK